MPTQKCLYNRSTNKKYRLNGVIPSSSMPSKEKLCQTFASRKVLGSEEIPPKVDLRPDMTPVEDQSQVLSCTANALAGAHEYLLKRSQGSIGDVSRLFIYYNARVKDRGTEDVQDSGSSITGAIEAMEESGACLESIWPYDIQNVNTKPNDDGYQDAKNRQITEALRVNVDLQEMKTCLAQGFPFVFGVRLFSSFDNARESGVVPMPDENEQSRSEHGRHAMLAVGYSDQSNSFIVRNSWGTDWGDEGYCYMPYDYLTNDSLCFDPWTVRQVETDDLGHERWCREDATNYRDRTNNYNSNDTDAEIIDEDCESNDQLCNYQEE